MSKYIALAVIAAGVLAADSVEVPIGATFEAPDDLGAQLIAAGKAKPAEAAPKERAVKVRVLTDCEHGRANDVATLPAAAARDAVKAGLVDDDKAAVAYALGLPQNKPAA